MQVDGNISRFPRQWEFGVSFQLMRVYPTVTAGSTFNAVSTRFLTESLYLRNHTATWNLESGVSSSPGSSSCCLGDFGGDSGSLNRS